jgi:glycosyltransferase involved in cell wall biosynthesis
MKRICLCSVLTPFVHGGAEVLVELLEKNLRRRGFSVERVTLPFKWFPKEQLLRDALAWRLLDVSGSYFQSVDQVICTKFPSYLVRHPNKVVWLFHQHREVYDFHGTRFSSFGEAQLDHSVRQIVFDMDSVALGESSALYTISRNVSRRLKTYNGIDSRVLYPPPKHRDRYRGDGYGDFVLSVGRLELNKRVDLLLRAMSLVGPPLRALIVGQGPQREALEALAERLDLGPRVEFLGYVGEEELLDLYSRARAVFFAPIDEDYGFVSVEALLSKRPVVSCSDAGGVLEFVEDGKSGLVAPQPVDEQVAERIARLAADDRLCRELGEEGHSRVAGLNWDYVVDHLVSA